MSLPSLKQTKLQEASEMVTWEDADPPVDRSVIAEVENAWGIKFPEDYVQCAMVNHGGRPWPNLFFSGEEVFQTLLSFKPPHPWKATNHDCIVDYYAMLAEQELLPDRVYPFAYDPAGNYLAFDYRTSSDKPSIVFLLHERMDADDHFTAVPVSDSFTELLDGLTAGDDEEE